MCPPPTSPASRPGSRRIFRAAGAVATRTTGAMCFEASDLGRTHDVALPSGAITWNLDIASGLGCASLTGGT